MTLRAPSRRRILPAGLFLAVWLLSAAAAMAQAKFEATLDRDTISLGESATLTMTVENGSLQGDLNPPPVQGLQYGSTSSQQNLFWNGSQMTTKYTVSVEVHPTREGTFTIPAIHRHRGWPASVKQTVTLKVVKGNLPPTVPGKPEAAFVRLSAPTNTFYVGQVIPLDIKCYCQAEALGRIDQPQLRNDAFIIGTMPDIPQRAPQVNINGRIYNFINFRVPVTPTKHRRPDPRPGHLGRHPRDKARFVWQPLQHRPGQSQQRHAPVSCPSHPHQQCPARLQWRGGRSSPSPNSRPVPPPWPSATRSP